MAENRRRVWLFQVTNHLLSSWARGDTVSWYLIY